MLAELKGSSTFLCGRVQSAIVNFTQFFAFRSEQ